MADDLEQLFAPPLASPSQDMRYRQGVILAFNQITLQNTVQVGGSQFTDLPILGVGESTLLAPGAVVGVISVLSERGVATWAIIGRMVIPNTADAFNAISLLSAWVATSSITTQETTNSATYVDLTTPGPAVTVNVRQTGRVLLLFSSQIQFIDLDPLDNGGGAVTVALTGANTLTAAAAETTIRATMTFGANLGGSDTLQGTYTQSVVLEGLNSGLTTFTMKYKANSGENTDFGRRTLTVITL
jgi:hypothetical protein